MSEQKLSAREAATIACVSHVNRPLPETFLARIDDETIWVKNPGGKIVRGWLVARTAGDLPPAKGVSTKGASTKGASAKELPGKGEQPTFSDMVSQDMANLRQLCQPQNLGGVTYFEL